MLKAITFDFWNTIVYIVDYTLPRVECMDKTLTAAGYAIKKNTVKDAYLAATDDFSLIWQQEQRSISALDRIHRILRTLDAELSTSTIRSLQRFFEEVILDVPPPLVVNADTVIPLLATRYRIGLVCDSGMSPGRVLRKVLAGYGLLKYFTCTVFSDEVGRTKPHRSIFQNALKKLDVKPQEALHVGDLLETDMAGAKGAGMKAVWFNARHERKPRSMEDCGDFEISELSQLPEIVHSISPV